MLRTLLFIGMGSFIGGIARFLLARWVQGGTGSSFPFGTLAVNVLGCLAIGLLYGIFERGNLMNPDLRLFLTVGLCGGFTTFSTFVHENFSLFQNGNLLHFIRYTTLSFGLGLAAACLGHLIVKIF
nr:fluoride efflux transporter CrcB [uncultured Alistipes sp.]